MLRRVSNAKKDFSAAAAALAACQTTSSLVRLGRRPRQIGTTRMGFDPHHVLSALWKAPTKAGFGIP